MKQIVAATVLLLTVVAVAFATPPKPLQVFTQEKLQLIEENLIVAFKSNIPGMEASAALTLRQVRNAAPNYDFSESIIPLMHIVKNDDHDPVARMAAALALHDLKSTRGDFAIERTALFEENPRVKKMFDALVFERETARRSK